MQNGDGQQRVNVVQ